MRPIESIPTLTFLCGVTVLVIMTAGIKAFMLKPLSLDDLIRTTRGCGTGKSSIECR